MQGKTVGVCHISVNALFPREDSMGENEMEHSIYQNCCGCLVACAWCMCVYNIVVVKPYHLVSVTWLTFYFCHAFIAQFCHLFYSFFFFHKVRSYNCHLSASTLAGKIKCAALNAIQMTIADNFKTSEETMIFRTKRKIQT